MAMLNNQMVFFLPLFATELNCCSMIPSQTPGSDPLDLEVSQLIRKTSVNWNVFFYKPGLILVLRRQD